MKTLKYLEKTKFIWFLIAVCFVFFLLRLPSLIEPYWYGDEGIYQVISLALNNGRSLYTEIWDNKPPLLYVTYTLFSGDQFMVRLLSLLFGISATIIFFFLARTVLNKFKAAAVATSIFTLLFATPFLEGNIANAENFMLPLIMLAGLLIYTHTANQRDAKHTVWMFYAGLLLGIAFLFKIVAIFDFTAFLLFFIFIHMHTITRSSLRHYSRFFLFYIGGFFLPIAVTFLYFVLNGTQLAFIQAAFFGNVDYVGYNNNFIIPQGFLILKVVIFVTALAFLYRNRERFSKPTLFILFWFLFAVFSAFFSQRPYTHYLLVILPSFCLLAGLVFTKQTLVERIRFGVPLLIVSILAINYFHVFGVTRTLGYYENTVKFLAGQKKVNDYQAFFDPETPRDYELISYIKNHTNPDDQIFVWGDSPQIYYLSDKLPPNQYTTAYHIIEHEGAFEETQAAIDKIKPKVIITLSEAPPIPFRLVGYTSTYILEGATIYERTL